MKQELELISLNVDDLDIEELERRLELAFGAPSTPDAWDGPGPGECCPTVCHAYCCTDDPCPSYDSCPSNNPCPSYDPDPCPRYGSCSNYHIP